MISENLIKRHEGFRQYVYRCTADRYTIGYGRNIDSLGGRGITEEEAEYLLRNDITRIKDRLHAMIPFYHMLNYVRRAVLISMAFNLGVTGLFGFKRMLKAVSLMNFNQAAHEMLDSKWAKQVPNRAKELSTMMRTGELNAKLSKGVQTFSRETGASTPESGKE